MTINQIEQLLDTKLAKLENTIVKGLNPTVVTSNESQQQISPIAIEKHCNAVTPGLQSSEDFSSSPNLLSPAAPSFPVKSFDKERTDLQKKQVHNLNNNNYNCQLHIFCLITKSSKFRIDFIKMYTYITFNLVHRMVVSSALGL